MSTVLSTPLAPNANTEQFPPLPREGDAAPDVAQSMQLATERGWWVTWFDGSNLSGMKLEGATRIGRQLHAHIRSESPSVSRRHAFILPREGGQWTVSDENSLQGTFINGIRSTEPQPLHHGDVIACGAFNLRVVSF